MARITTIDVIKPGMTITWSERGELRQGVIEADPAGVGGKKIAGRSLKDIFASCDWMEAQSLTYPFIAKCQVCGSFFVPIPLADMPIKVADFANRAKKAACPTCGGRKLVLSQAQDAFDWFDLNVRPGLPRKDNT